MEKKFTPGEWKLSTVETDGEVTEIYILQESGGCILCVNSGDDNYDIETDLANAHLIAAAPDLLEALQDMLSIAIYANEFDPELIADERISIARKAISKALNIK